jgi:hypothetical protein
MGILSVFPDVELALMFALVPMEPDIRFVTVLPAGNPSQVTARIRRVSGTNTNIWVDRPVVDVDVYGFITDPMDASVAARNIQADILSLMGFQVTNGVFQHVFAISGPKQLPEVNPALVRYNATYEVLIHATGELQCQKPTSGKLRLAGTRQY